MSCSRNSLNFSSQMNTWSPKSDLKMNNWDPYPENQDPLNRYGNKMESYCACADALYMVGQNCLDSGASYAPLQQGAVFKNIQLKGSRANKLMPSKENYRNNYVNPINYNNLDLTWNNQKPFTL